MTTETPTNILDATRNEALDVVTKLLDKDPKAVAESDSSGDTALHIAAQKGHIKLTKLLLQKGANPNQQNKVGSTPLHKAASASKIAVTEILLENNADANIKNNSGLLPEDLTGTQHKLRGLLQKKDAVTIDVPVPKDRHGLIIGKGGKNLEELRSETKTNITVPPSDNASTNITIVGRKDAVEAARAKITELLKQAEERDATKKAEDEKRKRENEERKKQREEEKKKKEEERIKREENYTTANVTVPKDRHGVIIGVHGATIREINAMGVKITIPPRESAETQIKVYGEIDAVEKAIKRIMELTHAPPRKPNNYGRRQANGDEGVVNNAAPAEPAPSGDDRPKDNRRNRKPQNSENGATPATASAATTTTTNSTADDGKQKREPKARPPKKDNATEKAKDSASEQPNESEKPKEAPAEKPKLATSEKAKQNSSPAPSPTQSPATAPAADKPKPAANKKKPNKE